VPAAERTTTVSVPPSLQLRLPPDYARLLRARERIRDRLSTCRADHGKLGAMETCIEKTRTNAIAHSGSADDIELGLRFDGETLTATIRDHGRGFGISSFDPTGDPCPNLDHGRDLFMIGVLHDDLRPHTYDGPVEEIREGFLAMGWEHQITFMGRSVIEFHDVEPLAQSLREAIVSFAGELKDDLQLLAVRRTGQGTEFQ